MDLLSRTLLDLLRLASIPSGPADPLMAAPLEDLLPICFGAALGRQEYASVADGLRAIADGRSDIADGLAALGGQIEPLRRRLGEDTGLSSQTAQVDEALRDLLMIQRVLSSESQPQFTIQPSAAVFQLMRQLRLRSSSGAGEVVLCWVASAGQRFSVKTRFLRTLQSSCRRSQAAGYRILRLATCDLRRTVKLKGAEMDLV